MAPCDRWTFEQCVQLHGLNSGINATADAIDAELLCRPKVPLAFEIISAASAATVIYLITNVYIHVAEYCVLLKSSNIWGTGKPHEKEANKSIFSAAFIQGCIGTTVYAVSVIAIRFLSSPLDTRSNSVVVGLSQLFAGVVFFMMSISVPQWFGIYHSNKSTMVSYTSGREIRFNLSWTIWKDLASMFFFNLYFSCADFGYSVLWGILVGIAIGLLSVFLAMKARSPKCVKRKRTLAIIAISMYSIGSWYVLWAGVYYILQVWSTGYDDRKLSWVSFLFSLVWVAILAMGHIVMYRWTKKKRERGHSMRFTSQLFKKETIENIVDSVLKKDATEDGDGYQEANVEDVEAEKKETIQEKAKEAIDDDKASQVMIAEDSRYIAPEEAPSYLTLFLTKLVDTFPILCGCCLKEKYSVENVSRRRLDYVSTAREKSTWMKFVTTVKRILWYCLSFFFLFFTIVNINASYEQCAARNALSPAWEVLYPPDYDSGAMCAWDKPGPNANITTFKSVEDVEAANFRVVHCGKCAACSNWNDLGLQWKTVDVLAGIGKVCAIKSLGRKVNYTDNNDPVVACNILRIGFTPPCAQAWAWDEVHTKNHAVFTFLQAQLANTFSDMEVTYQDITQATIDEAISGPRFVKWAGATRRRMNIKSDIRRPINQQCNSAQENWAEIFTDNFQPPVGGTYTVRLPGEAAKKITVVGQDSTP